LTTMGTVPRSSASDDTPAGPGYHGRGETAVPRAAVETVRFTRVFHGRADQVSHARHEVARHLLACRFPRIADAVLVLSELASNAVLHSASAGQFFTVRTEIFPAYLWLEVEDLGGQWTMKPPGESRPHGFDVVEALTPDWGVDGDERGRVAWARLEL
jgi:serine/threonine-protein kinase RsbW